MLKIHVAAGINNFFLPSIIYLVLCGIIGISTSPVRAQEKKEVELNFTNVEIRNLIDIMSETTQKSFLFNEQDLRNRKVTLISPKKYTVEEAYAIFEAILDVNGLTTIQQDNYIRIIDKNNAKREQTDIIRNNNAIGFVTRIIKVEHTDVNMLRSTITPLLSSSTTIVQYIPGNLLLIRDTASNINGIVELVSALDKKSKDIEAKKFNLKSIDAKELKTILLQALTNQQGEIKNKMFIGIDASNNSIVAVSDRTTLEKIRVLTEQMDVDSSEKIQLQIFDVQFAEAKSISSIVKNIFKPTGANVPFKLIHDTRTNRIIITAKTGTLERIKALIQQLDKKIERSVAAYRVYRLNHANAEEVAGVLQRVTKSISSISASADVSGDAKKTSTTPASQTNNSISITPDKSTNSLVVYAGPREFPLLERVIRDLDAPRPQVYIEALIMEVTLDKNLDLGIDWKASSFYRENGVIKSAGTFTSSARTANPETFATAAAASPSGTNIGILGQPITFGGQTFSSFSAFVQAAQRDNEINILSNTQVLALNNKEAEIKVGEIRPFQTQLTVNSNGVTTRSFDYKDIGVKLKLTPQVNSNNSVKLTIQQTTKEIKGSSTSTQQDFTPITLDRSINTHIVAENGSTVVIGGLISDTVDFTEVKTPCLGDIPFLGWMFKSTNRKVRKNNLLVFLTPNIIRTSTDAEAQRENSLNQVDSALKNYFRLDISKEYDLPSLQLPIPEDYDRSKRRIAPKTENPPKVIQQEEFVIPEAQSDELSEQTDQSNDVIDLGQSPSSFDFNVTKQQITPAPKTK